MVNKSKKISTPKFSFSIKIVDKIWTARKNFSLIEQNLFLDSPQKLGTIVEWVEAKWSLSKPIWASGGNKKTNS